MAIVSAGDSTEMLPDCEHSGGVPKRSPFQGWQGMRATLMSLTDGTDRPESGASSARIRRACVAAPQATNKQPTMQVSLNSPTPMFRLET